MSKIPGDDEARDFLQGMGLDARNIAAIQAYYDLHIRARIFRMMVGVGLAHVFLVIVLVVLLF